MEQLFASGRIVDVILVIMLAEYSVLRLMLPRRDLNGVALYLLSGAFLLLALRIALTGGSWPLIGCSLAGAGVWHILDLRRRFGDPVRQN